MDSQAVERMSSLPPVSASCTIKRSFVKTSSKEYYQSSTSSTESVPSVVLSIDRNRRDSSDRKVIDIPIRNRSDSNSSPVFRLKICDNSSGYGSGYTSSYGSATSFGSTIHSIQKTPSVHCFSNLTQQNMIKKSERPNKTQMIKDSIVNALDQIDKRVAFLRETAAELEEEKRKLHRFLNSIMTSDDLNSVEEVEREEIKVATHGLLYRLNSVDVIVTTVRSDSQQKALEDISKHIERLSDYLKTDRERARLLCQSYLSACSSQDSFHEVVDEKFQKTIVDCSIDDQKMVKKKLETLYTSLCR